MFRVLCSLILAISAFSIAAAPASAQLPGPPYTLTVTPPTGGKIQAAGVNCGMGGTACFVDMPASMRVGLDATAASGYVFSGWFGDCSGVNPVFVLTLSGPRTCGATFTPVGGGPTTPVITWATPAPITQGTALSATQLNATTTVAGSFVYSPAAGTVLAAGSQTLSTTFTPTNTTLYTSASKTVTLVVNAPVGPTTPVITWATPAPITEGTALSATQLNATTTVAGSFVYTPASGTVLTAGSHVLSTTFTPTNTTLYTSASKTVTQVVTATVTQSSGLSVYDANDVVIGPLVYLDTVTFSVDGERYAAGVGPDGWMQPNITLYFFDATCGGQPHLLRTFRATGEPPQPDPMVRAFFRSIQVVGSTGYYETGRYVRRVVASDNMWFLGAGTGPCTPVTDSGTAWLEEAGTVQLAAHQTPFTIR
jgi:uncharacterized repeat protein (TIGR02543 family)